MAVFRGPRALILQDDEGVWAQSAHDLEAMEGTGKSSVVSIDDAKVADRFRKVAASYGYLEDSPAGKGSGDQA